MLLDSSNRTVGCYLTLEKRVAYGRNGLLILETEHKLLELQNLGKCMQVL